MRHHAIFINIDISGSDVWKYKYPGLWTYDVVKHTNNNDVGWRYLFIVEVVKYSWSLTGSSIEYLLQKISKKYIYLWWKRLTYTIRTPYVVVTSP